MTLCAVVAQCRCLVRAAGLLGGHSFLCHCHGAFPPADALCTASVARAGRRVSGGLDGDEHWLRRGIGVSFVVFVFWFRCLSYNRLVHFECFFPYGVSFCRMDCALL